MALIITFSSSTGSVGLFHLPTRDIIAAAEMRLRQQTNNRSKEMRAPLTKRRGQPSNLENYLHPLEEDYMIG